MARSIFMGLSGGTIQSLTGWNIVTSIGVAVIKFLQRQQLDNPLVNILTDSPKFYQAWLVARTGETPLMGVLLRIW